jgi:ComF family protein
VRPGALAAVLDGLLAVLVAPVCAACARPLDAPVRGAVCGRCWNAVNLITPPVCDRCGDPLPSWRVVGKLPGLCPRCRRLAPAFDRARAAGAYDGVLRDILHAFKYGRRRSVSAPLAALMRQQGAAILEGADGVVPVPLHWRRRLARGFNQATQLARGLGPPVVPVLVRTRPTRSQIDLPAAQRHRNVRGAFRVRRRGLWPSRQLDLRGLTLVLVDDVATTGATLDACARALKAAGAREVRALTAARAVRPRP